MLWAPRSENLSKILRLSASDKLRPHGCQKKWKSVCRDKLSVKQVQVRLDNNDTEKSLQLVPETYGMDVPSACTIVIIAGYNDHN